MTNANWGRFEAEERSLSETASQTTILDSGERTEFDSGAVRDMQKGKGRCDLLPLDVVAEWYMFDKRKVFEYLDIFIKTKDKNALKLAFTCFARCLTGRCDDKYMETAMLNLSIHFEEGAEKYGERNWEKGLPVDCYINSAIRHYLKWLRGDTDERHDRAVLWNLICCIWTIENIKDETSDLDDFS